MITSSKLDYYDEQERNLGPAERHCIEIMDRCLDSVQRAETGNKSALMFLVGQYMRATQGLGDPAWAQRWFEEAIFE